jgi:hypothetical protein
MRKRKRGVSLTCIEEFGPEVEILHFLGRRLQLL